MDEESEAGTLLPLLGLNSFIIFKLQNFREKELQREGKKSYPENVINVNESTNSSGKSGWHDRYNQSIPRVELGSFFCWNQLSTIFKYHVIYFFVQCDWTSFNKKFNVLIRRISN